VKIKARDLMLVFEVAESFLHQGLAVDANEALAKAKDWVEKLKRL